MCVDNGMFTVSFLKEGLQRVGPISSSFVKRKLSLLSRSSEVGWMTYSTPLGKHARVLTYSSSRRALWEVCISQKPCGYHTSERSQ